jgi:hypothetical protein
MSNYDDFLEALNSKRLEIELAAMGPDHIDHLVTLMENNIREHFAISHPEYSQDALKHIQDEDLLVIHDSIHTPVVGES